MYADLQGERASIGLALAEYRTTAKFVGDTLSEIVTLVRYIKKGKITAAFRRLIKEHPEWKVTTSTLPSVGKTIGERWLQWNFAVLPLMGDVSSSIDTLHNKTYRPEDWYISASGHVGFSLPGRVTVKSNSRTVESDTRGGVLTKTRWKVTEPATFAMAQVGFGSRDIFAIAWDIIPFSFVFDWFFHVNRWIKQATATQGMAYVNGFRTIYGSCSTSRVYFSPPGSTLTISGSSGGTTKGFRRSVLTRKPIVGSPSYSGGQDYWHLTTSASLLAQLTITKQ
jgi:hypothetical protein